MSIPTPHPATGSVQIEKLNATNFPTWLIQVQLVLMEKGSWPYVSGEKSKDDFLAKNSSITATGSPGPEEEWKNLMTSSFTAIMLSLSTDLLAEFMEFDDPAVLLGMIKAKYKSNMTYLIHLRVNLYHTELVAEGSVKEYVKSLNHGFNSLAASGERVSESERLFVLLRGLPTGWASARSTILRHSGVDYTWVVNYLTSYEGWKAEELGLKSGTLFANGRIDTSASGGGRKIPTCRNCRRRGHCMEECWVKGGGMEGHKPWGGSTRGGNSNWRRKASTPDGDSLFGTDAANTNDLAGFSPLQGGQRPTSYDQRRQSSRYRAAPVWPRRNDRYPSAKRSRKGVSPETSPVHSINRECHRYWQVINDPSEKSADEHSHTPTSP